MNKKILVVAPSYSEISGGVVVLHKLCSILNDLGYESYLHPYVNNYEVCKYSVKAFFPSFMRRSVRQYLKGYQTNKSFNTPIYQGNIDDTWVVVYPEVVFGNPLNAKNVVRWLLHEPGYHEGSFYYGKGELYFRFNGGVPSFQHYGSTTSDSELKVIHYPLEHYNLPEVEQERIGTAYCLRKGNGKELQHDTSDSILIDGLTHQEVSSIFKKVKTFISYDTYTAYSIFAVLCGCESVVIPDEGVLVGDWYACESDRYGIAYGLDDINRAKQSAGLVLDHVRCEEARSVNAVRCFVREVGLYFKF